MAQEKDFLFQGSCLVHAPLKVGWRIALEQKVSNTESIENVLILEAK